MIRFVLALGLFTCASCVFAVERLDLYKDTVPALSQAEDDKRDAFLLALENVFVRVVGDPRKVAESGLMSEVTDPSAFVTSFSFSQNPQYEALVSAQESSQAEGVEPAPYLMEVGLSKHKVLQAVSEKQLPRWGDVRPSIMLWMVRERAGRRELYGNNDLDRIAGFVSYADQRGLPVQLPRSDSQDLNAIDLSELWFLEPGSVDQAAKRYNGDLNLLIKLYLASNLEWQAEWRMPLSDKLGDEIRGELQDKNLSNIWRAVVDQSARALAAQYAVSGALTDEEFSYRIVLNNIDGYVAYIGSQQALKAIPGVRAVDLKKVEGSKVTYMVKLNSSTEQFLRNLELGRQFRKIEETEVVSQPVMTLVTEGASEAANGNDVDGLDEAEAEVAVAGPVMPKINLNFEKLSQGVFAWLGQR